MQTGIENTQLNQDNLQSNPLTQEEFKGIENTQLHSAETTQPDALAQPVPAQKQLPADTYLYANTSNLGGVIQSTAKEYDIDPLTVLLCINPICKCIIAKCNRSCRWL